MSEGSTQGGKEDILIDCSRDCQCSCPPQSACSERKNTEPPIKHKKIYTQSPNNTGYRLWHHCVHTLIAYATVDSVSIFSFFNVFLGLD